MNQKSNYLFNNILTKDNNNNDNDEQKDDLDSLFKKPYQSLNVNIKGGNEKTELGEQEDEKEKENIINKNSIDKNIKDDINKFENSINKKEFHSEEKNYNNKEEEKMMKNNDINMENQNENKTNGLYQKEKYIIDNNNLYNPFLYSNNKEENTTNNNINSNINNKNNNQMNNNESLKEEDSNKSKQDIIIIENKNSKNDNFIFSDDKNKEIDNNLNLINNNSDKKGSSNNKNRGNIYNEKKEEYDFDIDEEEYNQLVNNNIQNNKNNKNETEASNDINNSKNNQTNDNEIKNNEYENNNTNYENEFKNESSIENQIENNNNNNNDIINDKDSNNNSEKLGNDEKIIISNTEDKNYYNKYIQSPFNSPIKLSNSEEKNNNIHFENKDNIKNPFSLKILTQSQINKISTKPKQKPINKIDYELLIKKLINLTDYHKKKIIVDESNINNDIISQEKKGSLEIKFKNFKSKIKELKDNYLYYLNNQKSKINDINNIKDLDNDVNIRQKREEMKNKYKELIKYINNIYKKDKDKKRKSYQTVIDCLKDYEKLDDDDYLNQNNIDKLLKNVKDNDNGEKVNDKEYKKIFAFGAILLPLLYLINFYYSNFK